MAVNPGKLLPPSKSSIVLSGKKIGTDFQNLSASKSRSSTLFIIKTQVIKIESLVSRNYREKLKKY